MGLESLNFSENEPKEIDYSKWSDARLFEKRERLIRRESVNYNDPDYVTKEQIRESEEEIAKIEAEIKKRKK